jgi:hypothetical protein
MKWISNLIDAMKIMPEEGRELVIYKSDIWMDTWNRYRELNQKGSQASRWGA